MSKVGKFCGFCVVFLNRLLRQAQSDYDNASTDCFVPRNDAKKSIQLHRCGHIKFRNDDVKEFSVVAFFHQKRAEHFAHICF